jgi:hypothetical protein
MVSEKFQKALDSLTASVESKKPEEADILNIVSIGMQEGLSHDFIMQSAADAYDQCKGGIRHCHVEIVYK